MLRTELITVRANARSLDLCMVGDVDLIDRVAQTGILEDVVDELKSLSRQTTHTVLLSPNQMSSLVDRKSVV